MISNLSLPSATPSAPRTVDARHPKYQEIKTKVHQDLLNRLNLERLTRVRREDAEPEIRGLIVGLLEKESQLSAQGVFNVSKIRQLIGLERLFDQQQVGDPHLIVTPGN